jgi:hypothetical protein
MAEMSCKIIKMVPKETELEDVEWICLTQDRDHWLAPVNTVMDLCVA